MRLVLKTLVFGLILSTSLWADPGAHILVLDGIGDDYEALNAATGVHSGTSGKHLVVIMTGYNKRVRAEGAHNICLLAGLTDATVVIGEDRLNDLGVAPYIADYDKDGPFEYFAKASNLKKFRDRNRLLVLEDFLKRNPGTTILLAANPHTLNVDLEAGLDVTNILRVLEMPFRDDQFSGFNAGAGILAQKKFHSLALQHGLEVRAVPSGKLRPTPEQMAEYLRIREGYLSSKEHDGILAGGYDMLKSFGANVFDQLTNRYGLGAPFVFFPDLQQNAWMQDALLLAAALDLSVAEWKGMRPVITPTFDTKFNGYPVALNPHADGPLYTASTFDVEKALKVVSAHLRKAKVIPNFSPAKEIDSQPGATLFYTRTAHDQLVAVTAGLGLRQKNTMIVAEGGPSPILAEVVGKVVDQFGRSKDVPVISGVADSLDSMKGNDFKGLEALLAESGGYWNAASIAPERVETLKAQIERQTVGAETEEVATFLAAQPDHSTDLVVLTTHRGANNVLKTHVELGKKLRHALVMGGVRTPKTKNEVTGEWTDGIPTVHWSTDFDAASGLFESLAKANVHAFLFSSDFVGGAWSTRNLPKMSTLVAQGNSTHQGAFRLLNQLRVDWMTQLKTSADRFKDLDVNTQIGPPLGHAMGFFLAVGPERAAKHINVVRGDLTFNHSTKTASFHPNPSGQVSVVMHPADSSWVMDQTLSYLLEKAGGEKTSVESGETTTCPKGLVQ